MRASAFGILSTFIKPNFHYLVETKKGSLLYVFQNKHLKPVRASVSVFIIRDAAVKEVPLNTAVFSRRL